MLLLGMSAISSIAPQILLMLHRGFDPACLNRYRFGLPQTSKDDICASRDESPAGYSSAGCAPAEPTSASPAAAHFARNLVRCTMQFQRTVNSVLTVCLTPGDNPIFWLKVAVTHVVAGRYNLCCLVVKGYYFFSFGQGFRQLLFNSKFLGSTRLSKGLFVLRRKVPVDCKSNLNFLPDFGFVNDPPRSRSPGHLVLHGRLPVLADQDSPE